MNLTVQQVQDIVLTELATIRDMARSLEADIDAGKEPDGPFPASYASDRGARMTLKRARNRLHHIEVRLSELTKSLGARS